MLQTLTERLFDDSDRSDLDPFAIFEEWFALAGESEPNDPHAMALATADESGLPDVRMVLLNRRDRRGFCFFTNFESDKGRQLTANPQAAMVMHWKSLRRQVRMRGPGRVWSDWIGQGQEQVMRAGTAEQEVVAMLRHDRHVPNGDGAHVLVAFAPTAQPLGVDCRLCPAGIELFDARAQCFVEPFVRHGRPPRYA